MTQSPPFTRAIANVLLVLLLLGCAGTVSGLEAALGETIPLSGYSPSSQWVYLYLTGPNLPVNGVMLNDITKQADEGHFTRVSVDGNDYWSYAWNTANVGGRLDAGTYTIWVVNGPNDRSNLAQADYRTLSVTLGTPSISVNTVQQYGSMDIASVPPGASVTVNGKFRGTAPLSVTDLTPGTHQVTLTLNGYYEFTTPVEIVAGRLSEVTATLAVIPEQTPVQTAPAETLAATVPVTTVPAATPTADGLLPALFLTGLVMIGIAGLRCR
ncbi:MAG: PEGA domain-containing protein [Methanoregula sp.]|jgi:hypothetical protein|nr:PEGA domain-containing protein [Methanoregula sp.]